MEKNAEKLSWLWKKKCGNDDTCTSLSNFLTEPHFFDESFHKLFFFWTKSCFVSLWRKSRIEWKSAKKKLLENGCGKTVDKIIEIFEVYVHRQGGGRVHNAVIADCDVSNNYFHFFFLFISESQQLWMNKFFEVS